MAICQFNNCNNNEFQDRNFCSLHLEKSDYHTDLNSGLLGQFNDDLISYIVNHIWHHHNGLVRDAGGSNHLIRQILNDERTHTSIEKIIKDNVIVFSNIHFPGRDERDPFDYLVVLNKLGLMQFQYCKFSNHGFNFNRLKVFYQDCEFIEYWTLYESGILNNVNNVTYQNCIFRHDVSLPYFDNNLTVVNEPLFRDCEFHEKLSFEHAEIEAEVFKYSVQIDTIICKELLIQDCIFNEKFIANKLSIHNAKIVNCLFNSKFEFKENTVSDFEITNTNFEGLFDAYETRFKIFSARKCIFSDFVGFENCNFGCSESLEEKYISTFTYVTFLSFTNFRGTNFESGLDILNTNLKESPNFLRAQINSNYTNRETFRIVKDSFDSIGNHIEANKFYVEEMKKYEEEISSKPIFSQDKLVFKLNNLLSSYGGSIYKPVCWIFFFSFIYYLIGWGYEASWLYKICPSINPYIANISQFANDLATNILPFSKFLKPGMEFVSLVFYVINVSLIWLTVVAIKRHTKR